MEGERGWVIGKKEGPGKSEGEEGNWYEEEGNLYEEEGKSRKKRE